MNRRFLKVAVDFTRSYSPVNTRPSSALSFSFYSTSVTTLPEPIPMTERPATPCLKYRNSPAQLQPPSTTDDDSSSSSGGTIQKTFYRRELPKDLVSFTSTAGRALFKECLDAGTVENYFSLVGNFTTQTEPAFCGLGSLAMVLNAMEVDPGRTWKGVWRWYSDEMLECCSPLELVKEKGITMEQFVCLAHCHGLQAIPNRYDQVSFEKFKEDLFKTSTEHKCHMVVSFDRGSLEQTGIGHFSPIGAYHQEKGLALVLDVARFKYPSYWAPIEKLWLAMKPIDPDTGNPRGYMVLRPSDPRVTGCP